MKQLFTLPSVRVRFLAVLALGLYLTGSFELQAQTIVPTQTDEIIVNPNMNGKADPGDHIRYKVTIQNTGGANGNNVQLNIVPDPRTTFTPGSFRSSPLALPDAYAVTGNVGLTVPAAAGLLANDFDDNIPLLTATAGTFPTAQPGGSIMINADGSFMYTPPPGFTGSDTYNYTLNDGNEIGPPVPDVDMATVTFTVTNLIWFIDNASVAATSDGRVTSPFKSLADFNAGSAAAADVIYIEHNAVPGNYTGGIVLQNGERLFGEGHTGGANLANVLPFVLATNSKPLPAINGTRPVITNAAGDGVTLAMNNTLRGFNVGNSSDFGMENTLATSVGNLVVSEVDITNTTGGGFKALNGSGASTNAVFGSISSTGNTNGISLTDFLGTFTATGGTITNPSSAGVLIMNGSVVFTYGGAITTNSGLAVNIDNHDSGNATFSGNITSTGQGILVQNSGGGIKTFSGIKNLNTGANAAVTLTSNAGATIEFITGVLTITTTTGGGFIATVGGTVTVAGAGNTITKSGNGSALTLTNVNASASAISFAGINVTGGTGTAITINTSTGTKNLGDVDVARSGGGSAIVSDGGGTLNVTDGTINSGNQIAFDINNAVLGMVFTTVSVNGAAKGMEISNTTGSFTVNGTGTTNASGGTIQNITTRGVDFFTATNITLKNMAFTNANTLDAGAVGVCDALTTLSCNAALYFRTITTLVLTNIDVNGTEEQGLNGANITTMTMADCSFTNCGDDQFEGCMKIRDLQGTCSITNSTFTFPEDETVEIFNSASATALNLSVTGCTFSDNFDNPIANNGLFITAASNVTNTINVDDCDFFRLKGRGVDIRASAGTMNANVTDCTLSRDVKRFMGGIQVIPQGTSLMNINVNRNTLTIAGTGAIIVQGEATSTFNARINNNIITGPHGCSDCIAGGGETANCLCTAQGVVVFAVGSSTGIVEVVSNTISGIDDSGNGIAINSQADGTLNVLVSTNTITIADDTFFGIDVLASSPTVSPSVCARIINNNVLSTGAGFLAHFRARASGAGTSVNLQGPGGPVATNWDGNGNTPTSGLGGIISSSAAGGGVVTFGGVCTVPGHPTAMIDPTESLPGSRPLKVSNTERWAGMLDLQTSDTYSLHK